MRISDWSSDVCSSDLRRVRRRHRRQGRRRARTDRGAGMNLRRMLAIVVKEVRQLRRDRVTLAMILGIPVMQLVLFGYAINLNLRGLEAGIADQANTAASRALVMDMVATGVIEPTLAATSPRQLMDALRRGDISVGRSEVHTSELQS